MDVYICIYESDPYYIVRKIKANSQIKAEEV